MDPGRGFISLARSFDESDIFQNEKWLKVFLWCLIQANHKDKNVSVKTGRSKTVVKVERGQFIFGRNKAADTLNMSPSTVRNIMEKLQVLESISMKKDSHFSIVTVCNYDEYQSTEFYKGQPTDNQRTTNGQPTDTTNKPNTPNNVNKKTKAKKIDPPEIDDFLKAVTEPTKKLCKENNIMQGKFKQLAEACFDHFKGKGEKKADWNATVRNWIRKDLEFNPPPDSSKNSKPRIDSFIK